MKLLKNKKGLIDDFGSLIIAGAIMIIIAIFVLVYAGLQENKYEKDQLVISNLEQASYSTKAILEWKTNTGMRVHELLIQKAKQNQLEQFSQELFELLESQDLMKDKTWLLLIKTQEMQEPLIMDTYKEEQFKIVEGRTNEAKRNSYLSLPRIKIPYKENMIEIIIKQVTKQDLDYYKSKQAMKTATDSKIL